MFCTQCGSKNAPESKFCTNCGNPLISVPVQPDAVQAQILDDLSGDSVAAGTPASQLTPQSAEQPEEQSAEQPAAQSVDTIPPVPLPGGGTLPEQSVSSVTDQRIAADAFSSQPLPDTQQGGAAARVSSNRKIIIGVIVAAVVLVAAVVAGIVTYNMELWGGKSLPDVAVASPKDSSKATDAKVVVRQLEGKGFKVKRVKEFSGAGKGKFLGYKGSESGVRVKSGSTVTVRESAGPGVPKDTVGKKADSVVKTFSKMGVPVHYKKVIVSDSSKTAEGSVVSTSPAPGQGVSDTKTGIYIGVATKSDDGLPSDIVGQNVSDVRSDLESKGYTVKVEKRLASKKNIGKVSGSEPGPGSQLEEGQTVTLYQGVDAKGAKQTYIDHSGSSGDGSLVGMSDVASGQWCTKAGDCITLGKDDDRSSGNFAFLKVKDGADTDRYAMADEDLISCGAVQQAYCGDGKNDSYLIKGETGAFDLFPLAAVLGYWCGDTFIGSSGIPTQYCDAGTAKDFDFVNSTGDWPQESGGRYRMMNLFAVFPVGSDVKSVESDGYFDASALAAAKKQKAVDTDRPFLMYRDVNQYKDGERESPYGKSGSGNPFLPYDGYNGSKNSTVKMKPAPSDETAYYLVEDTQPDWDTLEDANVKGVSVKSGESGSSTKKAGNTKKNDDAKQSVSKNWKTMSSDAIASAVEKGDFAPISGKYCRKDGSSCLTLDNKGNIVSSGQENLYLSADDHSRSALHAVDSSDGWNVPSDIGIELRGPDSDYRCGSQRGEAACYAPGAGYSEADINKPANIIYVFKGADPTQVKDLAAGMPDSDYVQPDSTKPFLKLLSYHMNASPSDQDVYYPVE